MTGFVERTVVYLALETTMSYDAGLTTRQRNQASMRKPFEVVRYDLGEPYHPNKADMDWRVSSIAVSMVGSDTYGFFDQTGNCMNPFAPYWGRLPTLDEILTFLQDME